MKMEKTQTIEDLDKIECKSRSRIEHSSEYVLSTHLNARCLRMPAERMVLEDVVRGKKSGRWQRCAD